MSRHEVTVSAKDAAAIAAFLAIPPKTEFIGACCGCGKGIPIGYPARVTRWEHHDWQSTTASHVIAVQKPLDVWCKDCANTTSAAQFQHTTSRRKRKSPDSTPEQETNEPVKNEMTPREIAEALFAALSANEGHGSKTLARMADVDEQYADLVLPILRKMREKGLVAFRDKQWYRV